MEEIFEAIKQYNFVEGLTFQKWLEMCAYHTKSRHAVYYNSDELPLQERFSSLENENYDKLIDYVNKKLAAKQ